MPHTTYMSYSYSIIFAQLVVESSLRGVSYRMRRARYVEKTKKTRESVTQASEFALAIQASPVPPN